MRSRRAPAARTLRWPSALRRRLAADGSGNVAGCQHSWLSQSQAGICRLNPAWDWRPRQVGDGLASPLTARRSRIEGLRRCREELDADLHWRAEWRPSMRASSVVASPPRLIHKRFASGSSTRPTRTLGLFLERAGCATGVQQRIEALLDTPEGAALYRKRQQIIAPVFANTKFPRMHRPVTARRSRPMSERSNVHRSIPCPRQGARSRPPAAERASAGTGYFQHFAR